MIEEDEIGQVVDAAPTDRTILREARQDGSNVRLSRVHLEVASGAERRFLDSCVRRTPR